MYTVDNATATSATLPNLQCSTEYTIWVHAGGGLNDTRSVPTMVSLPARGTCTSYVTYLYIPRNLEIALRVLRIPRLHTIVYCNFL